MEIMSGRYPAVVKSYDKVTRMCRVEIPGITKGGDVFPLAELEYPLGDKSRIVEGKHPTEIEMLVGDTVWVAFIGGDARYPIITGYRNPQSGNSVDWRRWHHANIQLIADNEMLLTVGNSQIRLVPDETKITVGSSHITVTDGAITIHADDVTVTGSNLKHNSKNVGDTHTHSGVQSGPGNTGVPN
jgi:hypothetical protein